MVEFEVEMEAAGLREERQLRFTAAMTANLMNCWLSRAITVEELLGEDRDAENRKALARWHKRQAKQREANGKPKA